MKSVKVRDSIRKRIFDAKNAPSGVKLAALKLVENDLLGETTGLPQELINKAVGDLLLTIDYKQNALTAFKEAKAIKDCAYPTHDPRSYERVQRIWRDFLFHIHNNLPKAESSYHLAHREFLFRTRQERDCGDFLLFREAETPVWRLQHRPTGRVADAYIGVGVLSAKSVFLNVRPLYSMRPDFAVERSGQSVRIVFKRSDVRPSSRCNVESPRAEAFFCDFRDTFSAMMRYYHLSHLDAVPIGTFLRAAASHQNVIRHGDLLITKHADLPPDVRLVGDFSADTEELSWFTEWRNVVNDPNIDDVIYYRGPNGCVSFFIKLNARSEFTHPTRPSIVLDQGVWEVKKIAKRVIPLESRRWDPSLSAHIIA